jgi:hypothetical protein
MNSENIFTKRIPKKNTEPETFSYEKLSTFENLFDCARYCDKTLTRLGVGTSRRVYKLEDGKVLKLAKDEKGKEQNKYESALAQSNEIPSFMAKIYNFDKDGIYLEMEQAKPVTDAEFKSIVGISFKLYQKVITSLINPKTASKRVTWLKTFHKDRCEEILSNIENYPFVQEISNYITNTNGEIKHELFNLSNYGLVNRDGKETLVVTDFGMNNEIHDKYYKPKNRFSLEKLMSNKKQGV